MAIILFPTERAMKRLCSSRFRGGVLCHEGICEGISCKEEQLTDEEEKVLSEIEYTVLLVNDQVERIIKTIPFAAIAGDYWYENSFSNWRDRSHFTRLGLQMLSKELDDDVISIVAAIEIFYLSVLFADEFFDRTEECENKKVLWFIKGERAAVSASAAIHQTITNTIIRVVEKKKLGSEIFAKMMNTFSRVYDETYFGFYREGTLNIEHLGNNGISESNFVTDITEYFDRISYLWGSQFEGAIRLGCLLFSDIEDPRVAEIGGIGRMWGQLLKLRDDILDLAGDKTGLGRKPCEDIIVEQGSVEVNKTLPLILFVKEATTRGLDISDTQAFLKKKRNVENTSRKYKDFEDLWRTALETSCHHLARLAGRIIRELEKFPDNIGKESLVRLVQCASRIRD